MAWWFQHVSFWNHLFPYQSRGMLLEEPFPNENMRTLISCCYPDCHQNSEVSTQKAALAKMRADISLELHTNQHCEAITFQNKTQHKTNPRNITQNIYSYGKDNCCCNLKAWSFIRFDSCLGKQLKQLPSHLWIQSQKQKQLSPELGNSTKQAPCLLGQP